jgi:aldehyde:ferredoxin oxidoreductase
MSRAGSILRVNLTERKTEREPTSSYVKKWFGGDGIGSAILCSEVSPQTHAYDPKNIIAFSVGPLTGMLRGASRCGVMTRSPLLIHNLLHAGNIGGQFPAELKFAGYDNVIVTGRADKWVYLLINNDRVEFRDAAHLLGLDTWETQARIKAETRDPDTQVICIGPAGESQVAYALILHDLDNVAGRCGIGAVMGSKNLKAIAVRGTKGLRVADPKKYIELWNQFFKETYFEPLAPDSWERTSMIDAADIESQIDLFMWGNDFTNLVCPPIPKEKTLREFTRKYAVGNSGCAFCPEQCYVRVNVPGIGAGAAHCAMPGEWQTRFRIYDPHFWWQCATLVNRLGVDCSSTCNAISWLMKLHEEGIITAADTDGIVMEWGSKEAALTMINKIARKEGFGKLLAEGILVAAKKIGNGAEKFVRHVKGNEYLDYWMWTGGSVGMALSIGATGTSADTSMVENAGDIILGFLKRYPPMPGMTEEQVVQLVTDLRTTKSALMSGDPDAWKLFNDDGTTIRTKGKAALILGFENQTRLADLVGVCDQSLGAGPRSISALRNFWEEMAAFLTADLGVDHTAAMLQEVVNRVRLQERGYEFLCGLRRQDETMPENSFEPMRTRQWGTRKFMQLEDQEVIKTEYYALRGCDPETGAPRREELEKHGLADLAGKLAQLDLKAGTTPSREGGVAAAPTPKSKSKAAQNMEA